MQVDIQVQRLAEALGLFRTQAGALVLSYYHQNQDGINELQDLERNPGLHRLKLWSLRQENKNRPHGGFCFSLGGG